MSHVSPQLTIATIVPPANWIAAGLALSLLVIALRGYSRLRPTTLAAPCLWIALSAGCLAGGSFAQAILEGIGLSAMHLPLQ